MCCLIRRPTDILSLWENVILAFNVDTRKSQVYGAFDRLPLLPIFYYGVSSKIQSTTTTKQNAHTKIPRLVKHVRKLTAYLDMYESH